MTTKKVKRVRAKEKHDAELAARIKSGLQAQERDRQRRERAAKDKQDNPGEKS